MQAAEWFGARVTNFWSTPEQLGSAIGQRGWNRQPDGGSTGEGMSPDKMMRLDFAKGSGTGTAESSALV